MAEAEGESLESWLSEYPGPLCLTSNRGPRPSLTPTSFRGGGGGGGLWQSAPGLASPRASRILTPGRAGAPSPRRVLRLRRATPAARGLADPGKATAGCLGLTGTGALRRLRDPAPQSPKDVKAPDWAGPPGSGEWCHPCKAGGSRIVTMDPAYAFSTGTMPEVRVLFQSDCRDGVPHMH